MKACVVRIAHMLRNHPIRMSFGRSATASSPKTTIQSRNPPTYPRSTIRVADHYDAPPC
jgi:hypothetical protein